MDAFSPEMIKAHRAEMERQAAQYRLSKVARAGSVSWPRRVARSIEHWFAAQQTRRQQTREIKAWETAELIVARNPHLTADNC